jgi:redox-sensitive bicupin YhaK (pirin superfamily)
MPTMGKIFHRANSRGAADHGWLKSRHTFSFADYYNPERMGFGVLRVINDDWVDAGQGFGTHPHRNMEIVSIPLEGELSHRDSEGNGKVIRKGEVQIMSAGSGIAHSEFNPSEANPVNFLQIWVLPKLLNIPPRYEQKYFASEDRKNAWQVVVSPDKNSGGVFINQDAVFSMTEMDAGRELEYTRHIEGNGIYVFVLDGEIKIEGETLNTRDAAGFEHAAHLQIAASKNSRLLVIEVPMQVASIN